MISGSNNHAVIELNCPITPIVTLGTKSDQIANTVTVPGLAAQVPATQAQDPVREVRRPYAAPRTERLRPGRPLFHPAQNPGLNVPGLNPWRRVFERLRRLTELPIEKLSGRRLGSAREKKTVTRSWKIGPWKNVPGNLLSAFMNAWLAL